VDASTARTWLVFFHVIGVLGFLAVDGVSIAVVLRLRSEPTEALFECWPSFRAAALARCMDSCCWRS
jgi:hypothetical protein